MANINGKVVIKPKYDDIDVVDADIEHDDKISPFQFLIKLKGKVGVISNDLKTIIEPKYDNIEWNQEKNLYKVYLNDKIGYIDKNGIITKQLSKAKKVLGND